MFCSNHLVRFPCHKLPSEQHSDMLEQQPLITIQRVKIWRERDAANMYLLD